MIGALGVWPVLAQQLQAVQALAVAHPVAAGTLYMLFYAAVAACCLPLGPALSTAGGSLFGLWIGAACAVAGATSGCVLFFLAARGTLGRMIRRRRDPRIARIQQRVARDGFAALLALRVAPVVPSWLVNLAAALANMRLRPFAAATALGLLPATLVFASLGDGLGEVLTSASPPGLGAILQPAILLPLLGLSALALLPVIARAKSEARQRKQGRGAAPHA